MKFRDAVLFARERLTILHAVPSQARMISDLALDSFNNGRDDILNSLIELSLTQGLSWEATKLTAIELIAQRRELPYPLSNWLIDYLAGEIVEPKRPKRFSRGWPGEHTERDAEIHAVVVDLVAVGFEPATRGDISSPTSACDAVARAMTELRIPPGSYKEIKRIYTDRKKDIAAGRNIQTPMSVMSELIKDTR